MIEIKARYKKYELYPAIVISKIYQVLDNIFSS
jgi:hypothetical protein